MLLKIITPIVFLTAFYFLIKLIGRMAALFGGKKFEFPVTDSTQILDFKDAGLYEVAIKRSATFGAVPGYLRLKITSVAEQKDIAMKPGQNIFGGRKDMSGNRIIPIAVFEIAQSGQYSFQCSDYERLKEDDKITVSATKGDSVLLLILGLVISGALTIAGLVFSILAFTGRLD